MLNARPSVRTVKGLRQRTIEWSFHWDDAKNIPRRQSPLCGNTW
jgi:hypothetical protein